MKKNNIIIFSLLLLLTIGIVTFNYSNQLVALFVEGAAPNPGHSLTEIEGGADLATKTYVDTAVSGITGSNWTVSGSNIYRSSGNVGIGTASPTAKLHVVGNIIASDPTADNHVATKKYVDDQSGGLPSSGAPGAYLRMTSSGPIWDSPLTWGGSNKSTYDCAQIGGTTYNMDQQEQYVESYLLMCPRDGRKLGVGKGTVLLYGGDSCGNHKSSGPTTWSNVTSYSTYGSGTGQLACGCSETYAGIWCSIGGQYGLKYTVSTTTNSSFNRLEVGVY